jgi:dihydroorotase
MARFGRLTDAPASFVLTGARVVDPGAGTDAVADLAVLDGVVVAPSLVPQSVRRIEADGLLVAPGLCDLGAHPAPDLGDAAAIEEVGRSAARGGFTTVCIQPDDTRPLDAPAAISQLRAAAVAVRLQGMARLTRGDADGQLTELAALAAAGAAGFVIGPPCSAALIRAALLYLAPLGLPLVVRAEESSLGGGALMRSGRGATRLGLAGWPASAEVVAVARDLAVAEEVGGRVHFSRISTSAALDAIRRARTRGVHVSCDVTPHHIAMHDGWIAGDRAFAWEGDQGPFEEPLDAALAYDANCRVDPPLPSRADAEALRAAIADGTVTAIATDHRPLPGQHKQVEFAAAAPGMVGLETALSLGLAAVETGCIELLGLLRALSARPAQLIGEQRGVGIGQAADVVVFDPNASWHVEREVLASGHANTPLLGRELPGAVRLTVADGRITYDGID